MVMAGNDILLAGVGDARDAGYYYHDCGEQEQV